MTQKVHRGNGTSFGPSIISRNDPWTGGSNPGTGKTKKYDYLWGVLGKSIGWLNCIIKNVVYNGQGRN